MAIIANVNPSLARSAAFASFFANGFLAQTTQILLLRELLVVLDGDELALGIVLAAWLCFAAFGSLLVTRRSTDSPPLAGFAIIIAITVLSLPISIIAIRLGRPIFNVPFGIPLSLVDSILLTLAAAAVPCTCIGALFPLMTRVTHARPAVVYGGEAAGALIAGLLFISLLVDQLSPLSIALSSGALAGGAGVVLLGVVRPAPRASTATLAIITIITIIGVLFGERLDHCLEQRRWRTQLPEHELLATKESPYGRYSLLESASQYSLYLDGQLQCDLPDPHASGWLMHTTLLQHPEPRSILIIGNALAGNVTHTLLHRPERIDVLMHDPTPIRLASQHTPVATLKDLAAPAVCLHYTDPALFLDSDVGQYDAILLDLPDPTTIGISRLLSRNFLRSCASHLAEDGVLACVVSSQADYLGPVLRQRNALIYQTVRSIWDDAIASPGDHCLILARQSNRQPSSSEDAQSSFTLSPDALVSRMSDRSIAAETYVAMLYSDPFPSDRILAINRSLAAWPGDAPAIGLDELLAGGGGSLVLPEVADGHRVNTETRPRAYWLTRILNTEKHDHQWMLGAVSATPDVVRWVLSSVVAVVVSITILTRRKLKRGRSSPAGLTLASAAFSFAVMAVNIVIVLWYQCRVGQMYIGLALLTAAFMAGTAAGAIAGRTMPHPRRRLIISQATLIGLTLIAPLLWDRFDAEWARVVAPLASGGLGVLLGAHFAWCCSLWPDSGNNQAGCAGWLYAADLIGGALAALLITAIVAPSDGLVAASIWAGSFAAVALLVIAASTSPRPVST